MNNKDFIQNMKSVYENLAYFSIDNNMLFLNYDGIYQMPISTINMSLLNPNLYRISPKEIFQVLYLLELLSKNSLDLNEKEFITSYVNKYLSLNDKNLGNEEDYSILIEGLSIPIYSSYDSKYSSNPASMLIENIINSHTEAVENSKGMHPKLVLTNPQFEVISPEEDIRYYEKAGFVTLVAIIGTVLLTCIFIIFFIF